MMARSTEVPTYRRRPTLVNSRWPRILGYHSISRLEDDPNMVCTSPERFVSQMLYLKRRKLRGVSMRELLRAWTTGSTRGLVGLTFDDGYEDFLHTAVPILERLGFSATVFVLGGMPGGTNDWEHAFSPKPAMKLLGVEGIREVSERGMEVGSHGMSHLALPGLETETLRREVADSRRVLSEVLGQEVEGFCYPYGELDGAAIQAVEEARYAYACTVNTRVGWTVHDLPRTPVSERDNPLRFAAKLLIHPQYRVAKRIYLRHVKESK
jgi:peptidoglycan/xylan/chitin deacetylase (PgdA/CDA1 family)